METPESDKMLKVQKQSQTIGEFLEWMQGEKNITFAQYHTHDDECRKIEGGCGLPEHWPAPINTNTEKLLAEFFGIDLKEVEKENRAILAQLRQAG